MKNEYCNNHYRCKGCKIRKEDKYGNCIIFVRESKQRLLERRNKNDNN